MSASLVWVKRPTPADRIGQRDPAGREKRRAAEAKARDSIERFGTPEAVPFQNTRFFKSYPFQAYL